MIRNTTYRLYIISGAAFVFALFKDVFVSDLSAKYMILELIFLALFLTIVYMFDWTIRKVKKERLSFEQKYKDLEDTCDRRVYELSSKLTELEQQHSGKTNTKEVEKIALNINDSLKGKKGINVVAKELLNKISHFYELGVGICYFIDKPSDTFTVKASFGLDENVKIKDFKIGEGFNGQAVHDEEIMVLKDIDEAYFEIESGTGSSKPKVIYLLPIIQNNKTIGLLELGSFSLLNIDSHWNTINDYISKSISL